MPDDLATMWAALAPIGRSAITGGYFRQPFATAERECHAWFVEQSRARELVVETDGNGNTVAWWHPGSGPTDDAVLLGSHLDSVLDGGAFDGPLGVVSALAALDLLRDRGFTPRRSVAVAAFAEEEGSRFGLACLGSRLATGTTTPEQARELRDRDGVRVEEAMSTAGLEPALGRAAWLDRIGCFVELHVEQGRDLVHRDAPVGLASLIWPHGRYRFDFAGTANHAGTTAMADRHDPMLTFAMTALAANKQARLASGAVAHGGARATFGRVEATPNSTNSIASGVSAWLDARAHDETVLQRLLDMIRHQAEQRAERDGTSITITAESHSAVVRFDEALTSRLDATLGGVPVIPTGAGHDAGILAAAGIPAAMLFVRNPSGVSHSPAEHAEWDDCVRGVAALAEVTQELTR